MKETFNKSTTYRCVGVEWEDGSRSHREMQKWHVIQDHQQFNRIHINRNNQTYL